MIHLIGAISALLRLGPKEQIKSPADAAGFLMAEMGHLDHEELRTVLLDTKNHLQAVVTVYSGSLNASMVRVGEVYKDALRRNSAAIIVAHNHPSSDPTPSPEDVLVTRQIVEVGTLLDVECLDHLVIGQGKWVSMRNEDWVFINNPSYFTISQPVAQEGKRWYDAFTATVYIKRRQRDANGAKTHTRRGADG